MYIDMRGSPFLVRFLFKATRRTISKSQGKARKLISGSAAILAADIGGQDARAPGTHPVQRQTKVYKRIPTINKPPSRQTMLRAASRSEACNNSNSAGGKSVWLLAPCPIAAASL